MSHPEAELARLLKNLDQSKSSSTTSSTGPDKMRFSQVLIELGKQSDTRIRSAARQVPLETLSELIYQFQTVLRDRKGERLDQIRQQLIDDGISPEELKAFMNQDR
ncbi:hypothetical protein VST7929_00070 [Vibrio stylophorae]|uniref:DNA-binding protein H-NS-like N-terminal domain-containing protein n=1 Tax=Vibrio stylophorae TaxID=659351 RepID=A0ABM8ZQU0_9VIBR|nr:hypothetical protein [Vibrio stylophorae]CAH0532258.1 hypothetical protein VST7929_00070 [Vibrio stylophorae]